MRYFILLAALTVSLSAQADQLAYVSKKQAKKAAKFLGKAEGVVLWCGCCEERKIAVEVRKARFQFTGHEKYWEVVLTYYDDRGKLKERTVDLAYVWVDYKGEKKTMGEVMKLEHDPCRRFDE